MAIDLDDETVVTVGPNSRLAIDHVVYDPANSTGKFSAAIDHGAFRFVTGTRAANDPCARKLRIQGGAMCIRGTDFTIEVSPANNVTRVRGAVAIGEIELFDVQGRTTRVVAGGSFDVTLSSPPGTEDSNAMEQALVSGQPLVQGSNHFIPFPGSRFGISVDMDQWQREPTQSHPKAISFLFRSSLMVGTLGVHPDLVLSENEVEPNLRADIPAGIANPQLISQERIVLNGLVVTRLRYKASIGPQDVLIDAHVYSGPQGVARIGVIRPSGRDDLAPHAERFIAGLRVR